MFLLKSEKLFRNILEKHSVLWRSFHKAFGVLFFGSKCVFGKRGNEVFCRLARVATVSRIILFFFFPNDNSVEEGAKHFFLTPFPCLMFEDLIHSIKDLSYNFLRFGTEKVFIMPLFTLCCT